MRVKTPRRRFCRCGEKTHSQTESRVHVNQVQSMRKSHVSSSNMVTLKYLSRLDMFVSCTGSQWKHRTSSAKKWKILRQASPTTRKQRYKQRIFNQVTFLSIKHIAWKQEPRGRKGGSSPEGQFKGESQAAVKSVTLKNLRMRQSLARRREVPQRHAGAWQRDRAHAIEAAPTQYKPLTTEQREHVAQKWTNKPRWTQVHQSHEVQPRFPIEIEVYRVTEVA